MAILKRVLYEVHLWLGILSGIVVFVVCLSGCVYVFKPDIEKWLHYDRYYAPSYAGQSANVPKSLPLDELVTKLVSEHKGRLVGLSLFDDPRRTIQVRIELSRNPESGPKPERRSVSESRPGGPGGGADLKTLFVDPYTGAITAETAGREGGGFFSVVMRLHRFLLLPDRIGRPIVGIATIVFVVIVLSGFGLWLFKSVKHWKSGLRIRLRKGWKPFLYDIHNSLGFYMLVPMLVMALTGLCWSFSWYRDAASGVLGEKVFGGRGRQAVEVMPAAVLSTETSSTGMSLVDWLEKLDALKPGRGDIEIVLPKPGQNRAVVLQKGGYGFWAFAIKDRFECHPSTGEAVLVERFAEKPLGGKICVMVKSLHLGDVLGPGSRIVFFFACLVATSLPVTGVILWINTLRAGARIRDARNKREKHVA